MATCPGCSTEFEMPRGRGQARKYCTAECGQRHWHQSRKEKAYPSCSVDGCQDPATRVGPGLCEKHYYRVRRQGTTEFVGNAKPGNLTHSRGRTKPGDREHSNGYVLAAAPGHPRALGAYRAYQHRVVFTDTHGEGPFKCNWCGVEVTWGDMHVDHLDEDKTNNAPVNLVASCAVCNMHRSDEKKMANYREKFGIAHAGEKLTLNEWAARLGISWVALRWRLDNGWPLEKALTQGRGKTGPCSLRDLL